MATVMLPPELVDRTKRAAVDSGLQLSQIVASALRDWVERRAESAAAPAAAGV